jgi:nitrogen fixation NifU-like protein
MKFDDLYQEVILDHYRRPRNKADLSYIPDLFAHENPTCGDSLKLIVKVGPDGCLTNISFDGHGCAVSVASTSMMCGVVEGKKADEVREIIRNVIEALRDLEGEEKLAQYGDLSALAGVSKFPLRVKCATLPWHALEKSLPGG